MSDLIATITLAANVLNNRADTELSSLHLTTRRIVLMQAIHEIGEAANATDVCNATGIDRSTASTMIKQLMRLGYVTRKRSPQDARAFVVSITDKGRDAMVAGVGIVATLEKRIVRQLSRASTDAMRSGLQIISRADNMQAAAE